MTSAVKASWEEHLPRCLGALPLGGELVRTEPRGPTPAMIAVVGLYPALTSMNQWPGPGGRWLPTAVENHSFEGSSSATELRKRYLVPLNLDEAEVFFIDLYPYYLANAALGKSGRTMWDNILAYQSATSEQLAVRCRPSPDEMVALCRNLRGNQDRISWWFGLCAPRLVLTLGSEAAAFARGYTGAGAAEKGREALYTPPFKSSAFGPKPLWAVHCAHPGMLMRRKRSLWDERHGEWCSREAPGHMAEVLGDNGGVR